MATAELGPRAARVFRPIRGYDATMHPVYTGCITVRAAAPITTIAQVVGAA